MRVCVNWIRLGVATPGCSDQWNLAVFSPLQDDCTRLRWSVGVSVCQSIILISSCLLNKLAITSTTD